MAHPSRQATRRHPVAAVALVATASAIASLAFLHYTDHVRWIAGALGVTVGCVVIGRFFGERVWPALGRWTAVLALRGYARWARRKNARLVVAAEQDFVPGRLRETWEAMAYAMALSVLGGATLLLLLKGGSERLPWLTLAALAACSSTTFILVPHWAFARLGLRVWETRRFVVLSLSDSYGRWLRLSNGTLLVAASFYGLKVLGDVVPTREGILSMLLTFLGLVAVCLALFGTAVAYFRHHEEVVVHRIGMEARRLGFAPVHPDALRAK